MAVMLWLEPNPLTGTAERIGEVGMRLGRDDHVVQARTNPREEQITLLKGGLAALQFTGRTGPTSRDLTGQLVDVRQVDLCVDLASRRLE